MYIHTVTWQPLRSNVGKFGFHTQGSSDWQNYVPATANVFETYKIWQKYVAELLASDNL